MSVAAAPEKVLSKGLGKIVVKQGALKRLVIEYVPIDSIKPNPYNPNRQDEKEFAMLQESMSEDGFTQPIIVQRASREIVDGEHRWRVGRVQGLDSVPVVFVDMTPEQMRISTLRHNRARGSEDQELVVDLLKDLRELGALAWTQHALRMSDDEINALINDVSAATALAGDSFTEGWTPARNLKEDEDARAKVSMSDSAQAMNAQLNTRLAAASNDAERAAVEQERRTSTFRLSVVFSQEDGALVQQVLGNKPVERLLALCTAYERLAPS